MSIPLVSGKELNKTGESWWTVCVWDVCGGVGVCVRRGPLETQVLLECQDNKDRLPHRAVLWIEKELPP